MSLPPILQNRLSVPVVGSPLFIISNPDLVIAQCKAGVVGSFPALNARPAELLETWLQRITTALAEYDAQHPDKPSAPFAVNQIVHKSNDRLEHDLALCVKYKVPIVITSLGAREEVNHAVHSYGGIVLHDVINNTFAKKAIDKGADGLIAVAAGAGGHAGTTSPFALIHEIREWFDGPLLLSGAIANGNAILAALAAGRTWPTWARPSSPPKRRMRSKPTSRPSWRAPPATSSTPTCSPACTATTCARASWRPAWTRTRYRSRTRAR